jgi:transcriptional regulator with XRE-family HTH domain
MKLPGLKFERYAAGLSQEQLAERSGVHRNTIQQLETGQRSARPSTVRQLAEVLEIDSRRLLEGEPPTTIPD